jgi:hypothetical protein
MFPQYRRFALPFLLPLIFACATPSPKKVNPEELSAEGHRKEAVAQTANSRAHEEQYTPFFAELSPSRDRSGDADLLNAAPVQNPTETHLTAAQWHKAHADAHLEAAKSLEAFEDEACRGVPAKERGACPLLGPVTAIRDVDGGVAIDLSPKVDATKATAVMRCHYAYARTRGFSPEAAGCPLYVRGLMIEQAGKHTVEITAKDAATAKHVRESARAESTGRP